VVPAQERGNQNKGEGFIGESMRPSDRLMRTIPRYLTLLAVWLVLAAIANVEFGVRPRSSLGWAALIILGPLAWITIEAIGEGIGELFGRVTGLNNIRERIARKTRGRSFSGLRFGWLLFEILLFLCVILGVGILFGLF
jgi:hypothetical protein